MNIGPQASLISGDRLHLHHGPIDLIIGVDGSQRHKCYKTATERFQTVLTGLVHELSELRRPFSKTNFTDPIARRMTQAVQPYKGVYVTQMAAVAGAVADEVLAAILQHHRPHKAYVNNGGDIALHVSGSAEFTALGPAGEIKIEADDPIRGIATSGWRGRSHSRGIADAVTVLAHNAAAADVAATLIANAVDLPGHPGVTRRPASELSPDSDLGNLLVTTDVAALPEVDVQEALNSGSSFTRQLIRDGLIIGAVLSLQGHIESIAATLIGADAHA